MRRGLLCLLLPLLFLGGQLRVGGDEPVPAGGGAEGFREYRHPEGYFALQYPADWRVVHAAGPGERTVNFVAPGENPNDPRTAFSILMVPVEGAESRQRMAGELPRLAGGVRDEVLTRVEAGRVVATTDCVVAGARAVDQSFAYDGASPGRGHVVGLLGPDALYFLILYAPRERWEAIGPIFARMRGSFDLTRAPGKKDPVGERGLRSYADPEGAFTLKVPQGWSASRRHEEGVVEHTFLAPGPGIGVGLVLLQNPLGESSPRVSFRRLLPLLEQSLRRREPGLVKVGEKLVKVADQPAVRVDYRLEGPQGPMRRRVWFVDHPGSVYILLGAARAKDFQERVEAIEAIVASLRFVAPR